MANVTVEQVRFVLFYFSTRKPLLLSRRYYFMWEPFLLFHLLKKSGFYIFIIFFNSFCTGTLAKYLVEISV